MRRFTKIGIVLPTVILATFYTAGCSSNTSPGNQAPDQGKGGEPSSEVYQYDDITDDGGTHTSSSSEITVLLNDSLKEATKDSRIQVEKYDLQAKAFGTGSCRIDAQVTYAPDADLETLAKPRNEGDSGISDSLPIMNIFGFVDTSFSQELVDQLPSDDELKEDKATYITKDYKQASFVGPCGGDPANDGIASVAFPGQYSGSDNGFSTYVESSLTVIEGDEPTFSFHTSTSGLEQSPSGGWTVEQ